MNIVLVGFMGTGKNAVGRLLAEQLKMDFVDTDSVIEQREGRAISEIFEVDGEPHFRKIEKEVCREVSRKDNTVVSAGGGAVLDEENINNFKKGSIVICLQATADAILERTKHHKHRPLLNVPDPKTRIQELLDQRASHYAKADHFIDTGTLVPEEVAAKIIDIWKKAIQ